MPLNHTGSAESCSGTLPNGGGYGGLGLGGGDGCAGGGILNGGGLGSGGA